MKVGYGIHHHAIHDGEQRLVTGPCECRPPDECLEQGRAECVDVGDFGRRFSVEDLRRGVGDRGRHDAVKRLMGALLTCDAEVGELFAEL